MVQSQSVEWESIVREEEERIIKHRILQGKKAASVSKGNQVMDDHYSLLLMRWIKRFKLTVQARSMRLRLLCPLN